MVIYLGTLQSRAGCLIEEVNVFRCNNLTREVLTVRSFYLYYLLLNIIFFVPVRQLDVIALRRGGNFILFEQLLILFTHNHSMHSAGSKGTCTPK